MLLHSPQTQLAAQEETSKLSPGEKGSSVVSRILGHIDLLHSPFSYLLSSQMKWGDEVLLLE